MHVSRAESIVFFFHYMGLGPIDMIVNTALLGEVEVEESKIIRFVQGMPGFEQLKSFILLNPDPELPFSYLQSTDQPEVAFLLTDPFIFFPAYEFQLPDLVVEELGISDEKFVQIWSVVSMKDDVRSATLNLLAPVVINSEQMSGHQVILQNTSYTTKHAIAAQSQEVGE